MNDTQVNANLNNSSCIQSTNGVFSTTYHNVCTGSQVTLQDGSGDVLLTVIGLSVFVLLIVGLVAMIVNS